MSITAAHVPRELSESAPGLIINALPNGFRDPHSNHNSNTTPTHLFLARQSWPFNPLTLDLLTGRFRQTNWPFSSVRLTTSKRADLKHRDLNLLNGVRINSGGVNIRPL